MLFGRQCFILRPKQRSESHASMQGARYGKTNGESLDCTVQETNNARGQVNIGEQEGKLNKIYT